MTAFGWAFDYGRRNHVEPWVDEDRDLVIATRAALTAAERDTVLEVGLEAVLDAGDIHGELEALVDRSPIHWTRLRTSRPISIARLEERLRTADLEVRYVASAQHPSQQVPPPLELAEAWVANHDSWPLPTKSHQTGPQADNNSEARHWFLDQQGVDVDRAACASGYGARLAVIDHDAGRTAGLGLDALVPVMRPPPDTGAFSCHGASLVAWATRSVSPPFAGVAPGASARLYCVPRPGAELISFPLALVCAVDDGADVVACATYLDGTTNPMLDDALDFASRFGRGGRGSAVVLAASREMASAEGSVRPSLSLELGDPTSDPRVLCVGASSRAGGWFMWRDRHGRLRPFSNRGPALRFMAPGDDVPDPFAPGRLKHAESSGATAFAAGTALLVLASNPDLSLGELDALLAFTAQRHDPAADLQLETASEREVMPFGRDRDGHNAKHGYGRLSAVRACLAARDPVCLALIHMGEVDAARAYDRLRREDDGLAASYSAALARFAARALLSDHRAMHALCVVLRHVRLLASEAHRSIGHGSTGHSSAGHAPGAVSRHLAVLLGTLALRDGAPLEATAAAREMRTLTLPTAKSTLAPILAQLAIELWPEPASRPCGYVASTRGRASPSLSSLQI